VADDHDLSAGRLRSWILSNFVTEHGTLDTAYEGPAHTAGLPNAVARALEDRHLLTAQWRVGSRWYELLSDRLIEPLRRAHDEWAPAAQPAEYLRAARRALAFGALDAAERYAQATLRASMEADYRLRAEAESMLGNLAFEQEKAAAAECRYRNAARLFEAARDTAAVAGQLAAVGQMLLAQGHLADAVNELRAAVERTPNDAVIQTELGRAMWQHGDGRGAVAVLTAVLGVDGGNAEALRARGEILADLGDAHEAIRDLDRVSLREQPSTRAARALALAELGDQAAASREIENAIAEAPRNGRVLLYGARTIAHGGDQGAAEELARRAVDAVDPPLLAQHRDVALMLAGQKNGKSVSG
jgi:tetratricopeptide (TPR) repeat protein